MKYLLFRKRGHVAMFYVQTTRVICIKYENQPYIPNSAAFLFSMDVMKITDVRGRGVNGKDEGTRLPGGGGGGGGGVGTWVFRGVHTFVIRIKKYP